MYEMSNSFLQSELDYRTDRLKSGVAKRQRRHPKVPRRTRSAATLRYAR